MRVRVLALAAVMVIGLFALPASAQVAKGEMVVPEFSTFSAGTTISVPDRGYSSLGGFRSASTGRTDFRPGFGRGLATSGAASEAGVRVWVHDFSELDPARPAEQAARRPSSDFAAAMQRYASERPDETKRERARGEPSADVASANDRSLAKEPHAADLVKRGRDAQARGKLAVAKIYFQSAARLAPAPSAREAQNQLRAIEMQLGAR